MLSGTGGGLMAAGEAEKDLEAAAEEVRVMRRIAELAGIEKEEEEEEETRRAAAVERERAERGRGESDERARRVTKCMLKVEWIRLLQ